MISPVMNVVSSPSSSPLLPPMSSMLNRTLSPIPTSPQSQTTNKRKSSTPLTNPNRFEGATEEELSARVLSDILQTNLDIVFVRTLRSTLISSVEFCRFRSELIPVSMPYIKDIIMVDQEIIFGSYCICRV